MWLCEAELCGSRGVGVLAVKTLISQSESSAPWRSRIYVSSLSDSKARTEKGGKVGVGSHCLARLQDDLHCYMGAICSTLRFNLLMKAPLLP